MGDWEDDLYTCEYCSRTWDGNAQCPCTMDQAVDEQSDDSSDECSTPVVSQTRDVSASSAASGATNVLAAYTTLMVHQALEDSQEKSLGKAALAIHVYKRLCPDGECEYLHEAFESAKRLCRKHSGETREETGQL